ncbi:transmembrane protein 176B-like [Poeciliopsis prolifica]|uniref:transmembrane protein 176B-like n=1 Tax=Poeciliopsis prolifica TaxID=188132 RepID=UPI0024142A2D|nr:transmembrane protein 176B-like [Poeciliopsis prolifica]
MSVTMSRTDGVTVFTLTSDPDSRWPPLCQILKTLCYSPVCCSVSRPLGAVLKTSLSVLAAVHMMIGLLNIGLGAIIHLSYISPYFYWNSYFPYWMGSLFIVFGIMCILTEKYPSPCLVVLNVTVNLVGGALAMAAIVLYSIFEGDIYVWFSCEDGPNYDYYSYPRPSPPSAYVKEKCLESKAMIQMLLRSITGVLIVLSVVELCVAISSAVLGIIALSNKQKQTSEEPEHFKPLLEEITTNPAV